MTYTKDNIEIIPRPTSGCFIDLTGNAYGLRTVLGFAGRTSGRHYYWWCECECGSITKSSTSNLSRSDSCGCLNNIRIGNQSRTHGMCTTETYKIWGCMLSRCRSTTSVYPNYTERGITVCKRWYSFENFLQDMGVRPSEEYSLDRINVHGNYCPENCRWATREEQGNNKRNNIYLTYQGRTQSIAQWTRELGVGSTTLYRRKEKGMSDEEIITTPFRYVKTRNHTTSSY